MIVCFGTDIDECTEGTHNCSQTCTDTEGSYNCSCTSGFTMNKDKVTCDGKSVSVGNVLVTDAE